MDIVIESIEHSAELLTVRWGDGARSRFHALWLRDHCQMPESRNAANGQRYLDVAALPEVVAIAAASLRGDGAVELLFQPEGHRSVYPADWLRESCFELNAPHDDRSAAGKTLWDAASIAAQLPRYAWDDYRQRPATQCAALQSLQDLGFCLLGGVPPRERMLLEVIGSFGFVRETNYGELFEVRSQVDANNLAFTNLGLGAHCDNPYRDPVPSIQVLHCLSNTVDGGESVLLDGFRAAALLGEESPGHFDTLAGTRVNYRFCDRSPQSGADLRSRVAMIECNERGEVIKVRYNNRSIDTLLMPAERVPDFYAAYRHYAQILQRESLMLVFKLAEGDCLVFDNTRVMHARRAFSSGGSRHLQGAYSDLDGAYSRLRVLRRELAK